MTFEQQMEKLKEIVKLCEDENIELDESLTFYKEGLKLVEECEKILNNFETEIEILECSHLKKG